MHSDNAQLCFIIIKQKLLKTFKTKMSNQHNLNSTQTSTQETLGAKISKRQMKRNKLIESQIQNQHQLLNNPGRFNEKMENLLNDAPNKE